MKDIGKILLYLIATVVLGALLAPLLFRLGHAVGHALEIEILTGAAFQKYFNRSVLITALVLLWPVIRWLNIRDLRQLNLQPNPRKWRHLAFGFIAAAGILALLGAFLIAIGIYKLKPELPISALGKIALTAGTVAVIEEFLFRAALLGLAVRAMPRLAALLFVSALYSIVHFLKAPEEIIASSDVTALSGFVLLPHAFWQFSQPMLVLGGFTTLFLLGWIFGYAALKTQSLWLPIGLHAGAIFGKFGFSKLTKRLEEALPWFGRDLAVGIGPLIVLAILGGLVWWWLNYIEPGPASEGRSSG